MKPFDLREIIQQRVNKESIVTFGFSNTGELRKDTRKPKVVPLSVGIWNFCKQLKP